MRVCAAVIRDGKILMVRHQHEGRDYWTLPGGGVEPGETPAQTAEREIAEETGLCVTVDRLLVTQIYSGGVCYIFLVTDFGHRQFARLGYDPEERSLPSSDRMLKELGWFSLQEKADDIQVAQVLAHLNRPVGSSDRINP